MAEVPKNVSPEVPDSVSLKAFFETIPPGRKVLVKDAAKYQGSNLYLSLTAIQLHCHLPTCGGIRIFAPADSRMLYPGQGTESFVTYRCRNCQTVTKTYALWISPGGGGGDRHMFKFGEDPAFGPPTPARVITLLGPEKEYFLKGRRSENQGLGIAAFAYYRRAVENQKNRILDEIIRVSEKIGASDEVVADLQAAKKETQFSKAIEAIKHGIPQTLPINGHNPLTLLHSALSEGLHAQTDEQCLELARSIRVVLADLAERLGAALKEEAELNAAVSRLLNRGSTQ
jgi:hypothetical protein